MVSEHFEFWLVKYINDAALGVIVVAGRNTDFGSDCLFEIEFGNFDEAIVIEIHSIFQAPNYNYSASDSDVQKPKID